MKQTRRRPSTDPPPRTDKPAMLRWLCDKLDDLLALQLDEVQRNPKKAEDSYYDDADERFRDRLREQGLLDHLEKNYIPRQPDPRPSTRKPKATRRSVELAALKANPFLPKKTYEDDMRARARLAAGEVAAVRWLWKRYYDKPYGPEAFWFVAQRHLDEKDNAEAFLAEIKKIHHHKGAKGLTTFRIPPSPEVEEALLAGRWSFRTGHNDDAGG